MTAILDFYSPAVLIVLTILRIEWPSFKDKCERKHVTYPATQVLN